jgi:aminoglycoside phosphotransferase (APT) family kinase protein
MTEDTTPIRPAAVEAALTRIEGAPVELVHMGSIAEDRGTTELKHIGYGEPALVRYRTKGQEKRAVLHTMAPNWFGHDRRSDRAALVLLAADTYAEVPRHTRVLDVGAFDARGELVSLAGDGEFYLLTEYAEGALYARDLRNLELRGEVTELDLLRARSLAGYLVDLHRAPAEGAPELYHRAVRDLVGSGEGIFGIADSYPPGGPVALERLAAIERRAVDHRWRARARAHRLRRTHGDFHPYNILFREGADFTLLDASRGGRGDPADDLAALTINYIFGAVVYPDAWSRGLMPVWDVFWSTYLDGTGDREVLEVIPLFFAWRALVVASPVWYPSLTPAMRDALLGFAEGLLTAGGFDPAATAAELRGRAKAWSGGAP